MNAKSNITARERQDPLIENYRVSPENAAITDCAITSSGTVDDPFHGKVHPGGEGSDTAMSFGIHRVIGGYHDLPNPGDILCAALAACMDSTIRIIANRMRIPIQSLTVKASANVDARGTLMVSKNVQVGFHDMLCEVNLQLVEGTNPKMVQKLIAAAEYCCVNMQTLRNGVQIETKIETQQSPATINSDSDIAYG